jgi:acetyl-CoA carboxylase biotin carboxyl carrier protein
MNENYIKKLIRMVEDSQIESLEVSGWGRKVRITKRANGASNGHGDLSVVVPHSAGAAQSVMVAAPVAAAQSAAEPSAPVADNKSNLVEIKSPMVGTFYTAPAPGATAYVSLNERITAGQVVCIVEAMKLMNEIESEVSGRIVAILGENAQPVEFGQVLFRIDPNG